MIRNHQTQSLQLNQDPNGMARLKGFLTVSHCVEPDLFLCAHLYEWISEASETIRRWPSFARCLLLEATKAGYAMFLKLQKATANAEEREKSSFGNLLSQMREERDLTIAERNRAVEKYNGLMTSHATSEGKLKAKMGTFSLSLEASKANLEGVKTSLQESVLEKEALALKLFEAEKSVVAAVETFKDNNEYRELLKDTRLPLSESSVRGSPRISQI
ncbi:hypothetical protein LIER_25414 [Lithospermum erythrorhizon]|uniref:Uncharacterized protein n=1 Tax=Lithospermum erythrorhizon TaxID=34254 RepID=A0AAV3R4P5_LITER